MTGSSGETGLTPGQWRILAVGFVFPVVFGGFGAGTGLYALIDPNLAYSSYLIAPLIFGPIALLQYRLWRATIIRDAAVARAALGRAHPLYLIPFGMVVACLLLCGGLLVRGVPVVLPDSYEHEVLVVSLAGGILASCTLPFTVKAMAYLPAR